MRCRSRYLFHVPALMSEVADAREGHGKSAVISCRGYFRVADGAAGLDGSGRTSGCSGDEAVRERKECVTANHAVFEGEVSFASFPDSDAA